MAMDMKDMGGEARATQADHGGLGARGQLPVAKLLVRHALSRVYTWSRVASLAF